MTTHWFYKRWLLQGLIVCLPIAVTTGVLYYVVLKTDQLLWFVCSFFNKNFSFEPPFPGLGLLLVISLIIFMGALTESFLVRKGIDLFNKILSRVPLIKDIYSTVLKVVESVLDSKGGLSNAVIIEYPRKGCYALAFLTSNASVILNKVTGEELVNVFLPSTPLPSNGFYLLVKKSEIIPTNFTSEEAFKLILSAGMAQETT